MPLQSIFLAVVMVHSVDRKRILRLIRLINFAPDNSLNQLLLSFHTQKILHPASFSVCLTHPVFMPLTFEIDHPSYVCT